MQESHPPEFSRIRVDAAGRVVVPAELRERFGIQPGSDLSVSVDDDGIHLRTAKQMIRAAQDAIAPYRTPGVSVVDELIRERRDEAKKARPHGERPGGA